MTFQLSTLPISSPLLRNNFLIATLIARSLIVRIVTTSLYISIFIIVVPFRRLLPTCHHYMTMY